MKTIDESNFDLKKNIKNLVTNQPFAVLCTQGEEQPYGSLIAFAFTEDLKHFFFSTPTATKKYSLLEKCDRVALVIDSRSTQKDSVLQIEGITIIGKAVQLTGKKERTQAGKMLSERHTYFSTIIQSESTAYFRIDVARYQYVTRFQEVWQWVP